MTRALILVDHGSRMAQANESLDALAALVRERGEYAVVLSAHMELAAPDIPTAIAEAVARGANDVTVMPYMLAPGRHAARDIPQMVASAAADHPGLACRVSAPLGVHTLLAELVLLRAREARGEPA